MASDYARLRELFLATFDLPEAQQIAMVDEQCADDPELRQELQLLLRTDARESGLFADDKTTEGIQFQLDTVVESVLPKQIGRYQVQRVLGEGGMGVVYLAEQQNPARTVAIKVIRSGLADRQTIARFEAERQALSMMDHPNIARVLDAGETDDGTPYFVMELVRGDPITKYCDTHKLTLSKRLELFAQACDAIQHAHHKGIVHRDLKPSNILVGVHDGAPRVKVIDFGLAKALEHQTKLTDKTVFTEFGNVVGTVQYMSPEQAQLDSIDIDAQTDIYSLGVILYELLTGSTPIEKATLQDHAILQVLDIVRHKDPPRPSDRLSSSLDSRDSISALRQIQPAKLQQILRGELDWIIMRALEKDRTRRYTSPSNFAADVRRYLSGEAVEARPPSSGYRLRKFVTKNRVAVGIFAGFLTLVCVASAAVFSYAIKADASAKRSDAILQIVADSFHAVNPESGSDAQMSAKDVLVKAHESLDGSDLDDAGKRQLLRQLNDSVFGIGESELAIQVAEEWRASAERDLGSDDPDTLNSMNNLAINYSAAGRSEESIRLFEQTLSLRQAKLGPEHLDTFRSMNNLANAYRFGGQTDKAIELHEQVFRLRQAKLGPDHADTLSSMHNLANDYRDAGRTEEALNLDEQTLSLSQAKLGPDHPDTLSSMTNLAIGYDAAGRSDEAIELFEQTLGLRQAKLGSDHPDTLNSMSNLALCYRIAGRTEAAITLNERTLKLYQARLGPDHPTTLGSMSNLAMGYRAAGRTEEAIKLNEETLDLRQAKLGKDHPHTLTSMHNLALAYRHADRTEEAIKLFEQTLRLRHAKLGRDHPDTLDSMHSLANDYRAVGRVEEAIKLDEESLLLQQARLGRDDPQTLMTLNGLVWTLASTEGMEHRLDGALLKEIRRTCERTQDGDALSTLALTEYRLQNFAEAIDAANASNEKMPPPPHPINLAVLAMSHFRLEHESEAIEFREKFQQAMQSEAFEDAPDCQKFAAEVEALFAAKEESG